MPCWLLKYSSPFLLLFFCSLVIFFNLEIRGEQQFVTLTKSFLSGRVYLIAPDLSGYRDAVVHNGHYFWTDQAMPAVILTPFVFLSGIFSRDFLQGYFQIPLVLATTAVYYYLAKIWKYSPWDRLVWVTAFCLGTPFLGVALLPWSWFFGQVITTLALSLAIYFYFRSRNQANYLLIGLLMGLAAATRISTLLGVMFFAGVIVFSHSLLKKRVKQLILLGAFPLLAVLSALLYNYLRFGNIFSTGHALGPIGDASGEFLKNGVISLLNSPKNLAVMFLGLPTITTTFPYIRGNPWGMSILITSPYLLYLLFCSYKDRVSQFLILTALAILVFLSLIYTSGALQFGYRYSLDFLPFLFPLLLSHFAHHKAILPTFFKVIIIVSSCINLYLWGSIYL